MKHLDVVQRIGEVMHRGCDSPADELIKMGKTLMDIGTILKEFTPSEGRSILRAVMALRLD